MPKSLAFLILVTACHPAHPPKPADGIVHRVKLEPREPGKKRNAKRPARPVQALVLEPVAHGVQMPGAVFDRVEFDIGYPILHGKDVAQVKVTPPLAGEVKQLAPQRFVFEPDSAPALDTAYRFEVVSVSTAKGAIVPKNAVWKTHTPAFAFLGADFSRKLEKVGRTGVRLRYSAAPRLADVKRLVSVLSNDRPMPCEPQATDHATIVELMCKLGPADDDIVIDQKAGIAAVSAPKKELPAVQTRLMLPKSIVEVKSVASGSLGSRRYIEVFCMDELEPKISLYSPEYLDVSTRCMPENSDAIVIEPRVKTTLMQVRGGFRIFGPFERGRYLVHLPSKLRSVRESSFITERMYPVRFEALDASVTVAGRGRYLPPEAWQSLGLRTRNLLGANVTVRHIPPPNLSFWLSDSGESAGGRDSDLVAQGTLDVTGNLDEEQLTYVDLDDLVKDRKPGVYEIRVDGAGSDAEAYRDNDEGGRSQDEDDDASERRGRRRDHSPHDIRRFLYTHINLVAKRESGSVRVWTFDLDSLETISGAQVTLVVPSGRVLSSCSTDGDGSCALAGVPKGALDNTEPMAVIARKGDDLSYLRFSDLKLQPVTDVGGPAFDEQRPLSVVTYTDRGVYRPGETAHLVALVRDGKVHAPSKPVTIEARLIDPKTRLVRKLSAASNAAGAAAFDFSFGDDADTGRYNVDLYADNANLGHADLQVEEFVPERMQVSLEAKKADNRVGSDVTFKLAAKYLFGGSAEGSGYKLRCSLKAGRFTAEKFAELQFGALDLAIGEPRDQAHIPVDEVEEKLAKGGLDEPSCKGGVEGAFGSRPQEMEAQVAVMESGSGRATVAKTTLLLHPAPFYLGIKLSANSFTPGQPIQLSGAAVSTSGELKPLPRDATVDLLRLDHNVYWRRYREDVESSEYSAAYSEGKKKLSLKDGTFSVELKPDDQRSDYLVRVTAGKAVSELLISGNSGDWYYYSDQGEDGDGTPHPQQPSTLVVGGDGKVQPGKPYSVRFDARFAGRALVTVETDRILHSQWIDVKPGKNQWQFTLDAFAPNVYASVLAFKNPHQESEDTFLPERAFGVRSLPVDYSDKQHALKVTVPSEIRSQAGLDVLLDVGPQKEPVFATVAAVDEGILRLTRFESPDPLKKLFTARALAVDTFETVGWNVAAPAQGKQVGGDADEEKQTEGTRAKPIRPVALWSGMVQLDPEGRAHVHFDVPTYRGALRVMAVTLGAEKLGAMSEKVLVRDPVVVQTTAPRFLVKDDQAHIPVFLSNLSGEGRDISVEIKIAEPVEDGAHSLVSSTLATVEPIDKSSIHLGNNQSGTLRFKLTARALGVAKIEVRAVSKGLTVGETLEVPIEPGLPLIQKLRYLELKGETTRVGGAALGSWVPGSERTTVRVATNQYAQSFGSLDYLLQYPYGCIEQTTSATRPLLAARRLLEEIPPKLHTGESIDQRLQAGIRRIFSMQTPTGGFSYWPGGHEPDPWGSAYATHLLLDARDAKIELTQWRVDDALDYLERTSNSMESYKRYYNGWSDARTEPYIQYVLARAGRGRAGRIRELIGLIESAREFYFKANQELADLSRRASLVHVVLPIMWLDVASLDEDLFVLKAALYLSGDKKYAKELHQFDVRPIYYQRLYYWTYFSDMRKRGMELAIYGDLFGASSESKPIMDLLAEAIFNASSYASFNTQEISWALTALAKQIGPSTPVDASLSLRGKTLAPRRLTPRTAPTWTIRGLSENQVSLTIPKTDQPRYALMLSEGIPARLEDVPLGDHGIEVVREYLNSAGDPVSLDSVSLGDVIYVKLSLSNSKNRLLQNVAVVDRLPAGFEIENPRLGRGDNDLDWMHHLKLWSQDFMNLRDDRFEAFGSLYYGDNYDIVYAVRATGAGKFTAPPAQAEVMYDPDVWGRTQPASISVQE